MKAKLFVILCACLTLLPALAFGMTKGIYITQSTLEHSARLTYLIEQAKASGINTFVIDFNKLTKLYQRNITLVKDSGLRYVARIVVFADGGSDAQILSEPYWNKKYQLMQQAVALGAQEIQLDYIRYNTKQPPSSQNAKNVTKVIQWYKTKLAAMNIPLQADVFGVTGIREELRIGQNVKLIGPHVDALCPMVYPSHYEPYKIHAVTPYETVYTSLDSLKKQFNNQIPFKLYPYIELSNYRYPLSTEQRHAYIRAQLKAVNDVQADGWFAWSPNNKYEHLFRVLQNQPQISAS
jgi:hypothetical protein